MSGIKSQCKNRHLKSALQASRSVLLAVFAVVSFSAFSHAACTAPEGPAYGLAGHWKLDESSGTTANDATTNNNDGTMQGGLDAGTDSGPGKIVNALTFNNSSDYIDLNTTFASITGSQYKTLSAWVKAGNVAETDRILTLYSTSTNSAASIFKKDNNWGGGYRDTGDSWTLMDSGVAVTTGAWTHVALVQDGSSVTIYVNGVSAQTANDAGTPATSAPANGNIGSHLGGSEYWDGEIDDIRIYDRALSADEVSDLYNNSPNFSGSSAPAGYVYYNTTNDALFYCNGTNWVMAGVGSYNPTAVYFDGTNDYIDSALTGITDSKKVTGSFWFRRNGAGVYMDIFWIEFGTSSISFTGTDKLQLQFRNEAVSNILKVRSTTQYTDTNWHHALFSFDLSDTTKRHLYIDGVDELSLVTYVDDIIDFTRNNYSVGANTGGTDKFYGDIADFWLDFGTYIDLSQEANRRKFISADGLPMYLGKDGSIPVGAQPEIFLSGDVASWHTNKGSGGGFTENGEITFSSSQPGDSLLNSGGGDVVTGLVSLWKLDESSGTTAADSIGSNDGTLTNFPASPWLPSGGQVNGALDFAGTDDYISITQNASLDFGAGESFSFAAWVKGDGSGATQEIFHTEDNLDPRWLIERRSTDIVRFELGDGSGGGALVESSTALSDNAWHHIVATRDGSTGTLKIYIDGNAEGTPTGTYSGTVTGSENYRIGAHINGQDYFDGLIDDVRIYNRALSSADVALLYAGGNCAGPSGVAGQVIYNTNFNVMQYCNGKAWVAMGPTGGTPPTSGLVGHWKLDESSGTTAADETGTNNGTLVNMDPATDWLPSDGKIAGALDFSGSDDYVTAGNDASLTGTGAISISAWVKSDTNQNSIIVSRYNTDKVWRLQTDAGTSTPVYKFSVYGGCSSSATDTSPSAELPNGVWYHIVGVYEPSTAVRLYINGQLDQENTSSIPASLCSSTQQVLIGARQSSGSYVEFWDGMFDDVRIYNRVLTDTEVSQLYHYGMSGGIGDVDNGCASPAGTEAEMFYNGDNNVLQYCNGESWIGVGQ